VKVAIIMAGDLRDFTVTYPYFRDNVLFHQDCDIYMHCYNSEHTEAALDLYLPEKYKIEDRETVTVEFDDACNRNTFVEVDVAAGFYQWRSIKEVFDLIDCNKKYDFVFKSRYDLAYLDPFCIEAFGLDNSVYNIPDGGDWRGGLNDMVAISSYENMKYYSSMYNYMNGYTLNDNVPSHSEVLLRHHLEKRSVEINRIDCNVYLRKFYDDTGKVENRRFNLRGDLS